MNIRALKYNIWPDHATLGVGIDADKWVKRQDVLGVGQLALQRGVACLQGY